MTLKRRLFVWLALLFVAFGMEAQHLNCQSAKQLAMPPGLYYNFENLRSDTVDILKYTINLEIGNFTTKAIQGNTTVRYTPKMNNLSFLRLDLLKLTVDSVKENGTLLLYSYNDTILKLNLPSLKNVGDTSSVTVYYKGQPQGDASGWGGFYFDNNGGNQYAYNLGVGFAAKPHNYGRVWFPCFDNFVERSKYEFNITSDTARRAYCNRVLVSDVVNGLTRTRKWVMNEEIPTYLASVALARYRQVNWTVNTLTGIKPITLVGAAADTTPMKNGFVNLKTCINGFENYFGPYKWNRFGYCLVPFSSGAMEHATNIAYPRLATGIGYEAELMAHELSHHWWGDLITCETAEDMWINEGMATYSSYLFNEWKYGKAKYFQSLNPTHEDMLHFLHKKEGGFRAISGIPHNLTYGDHVYKKGADVAHTLRGYMGDSAFFTSVKYVMNQSQYKSINSIQFRDLLQTASGQNLVDFFNNWVLAGGWPHYSIDTVRYTSVGSGSVIASVSIKQKLYGAPAMHTNVPLEVSFFDGNWNRVVRKVILSGAHATFTVNVPFNPVYSALNYDSKINDATAFETKTIKTVSNFSSSMGKVAVYVTNKGADSSLLRLIHHYVRPDGFKMNQQNIVLSDQHYWSLEGILSPGFKARVRFNYDGNKSVGGTYSYLDTLLTKGSGDSIKVYYRKDAADDWKPVNITMRFPSSTKTGWIEIDSLKLGEYALGSNETAIVASIKKNETLNRISLYPNPIKNILTVEFSGRLENDILLRITTIEGRLVKTLTINEKISQIDMSGFARGSYLVNIHEAGMPMRTKKILLD